MSTGTPDSPGARIRMLRRANGWTQQDLAKRVHATQAAVSHWESGRYHPALHSQIHIAEALRVTRIFLFGERA